MQNFEENLKRWEEKLKQVWYQHELYVHVHNLVGDVQANPKEFYRYINSQKKCSMYLPFDKRNGSDLAKSDFEVNGMVCLRNG